MSLANSQLTPFNLFESHRATRSHLLPSDMSGILTHSRHGRARASPLIHPDRPGRPGSPNTPHDEQLIEQTRKWVAQTFFGTMLKQMRNSPFKSPIFEGGRGGQAFGEMYDQRLAEHMSHGAGNKLVGALVRSILSGQKRKDAAKAGAAYARQSKLAPKAAPNPINHDSANRDANSDARRFARKRAVSVPPNANSLPKARPHVATGL